MAAITASMQTLCAAGDNFVSVSQLYGGTYNLFAHTFPQQGIDVRMASGDDIPALEALIDENTKAIFCESIGNPAGNIIDLAAVSEMAHKHQIPVVVDNTVATPYGFKNEEDAAGRRLNGIGVVRCLAGGCGPRFWKPAVEKNGRTVCR